jgi:(-)-germacrene D synthase
MKTRAHARKEAVRQRILDAASSDSLIRKLELVDTLQRIGVAYHYEQEIDELLRQVYNDVDKDGGYDDDLYVTSLRFYLLRKHGYNVSSGKDQAQLHVLHGDYMHAYEHSITVTTWYADVFLKFRDEQGNISSDDANCLMTLYDAAHLRTHGEHVLDSVIVFNRIRLQLLLMRANLQPDLAGEVRLTLETPRFRRVKRVEARRYLAAYEKMAARDDAILEFAKSGYNIVQALYCEELKELTM